MSVPTPRAAYLDLDGTLLAPDGRVVGETLETVAVLRAAGWTPALLTGRSRPVAVAVGRLLGVDDVVCELGAIVVADGREHRTRPRDAAGRPLRGPAPVLPAGSALLAAIDRAGTCRAQPHEPGTTREGGHVLRVAAAAPGAPAADRRASAAVAGTSGGAAGQAAPGHAEPAPLVRPDVSPTVAGEVTRALTAAGLDGWHAVDNGPSHLPLADGTPARVVHVVPRGVDKRAGVLEHRELRGVARGDAVALGDGPADLDVAPAVGRVLLVAGDAVAMARARELGVAVTRGIAAVGALAAARDLAGGR